jgi:C4-dicarboxylate-specific signal transduction histidine kinase
MQNELAHANRVATMGQLTASIAHEIKQPIATAHNNARAVLNFLDKNPPDVAEVREALTCIVDDTDRAGDIIDRIRDPTRFEILGAARQSDVARASPWIRQPVPAERGGGVAFQKTPPHSGG